VAVGPTAHEEEGKDYAPTGPENPSPRCTVVRYSKMQTHERLQWGMMFIPAARYTVMVAADLILVICFTYARLMPTDEVAINSYHAINNDVTWIELYLMFHVCALIASEIPAAYSGMFGGLEFGAQWKTVATLYLKAGAQLSSKLLSETKRFSRPPSPVRSTEHVRSWRADNERKHPELFDLLDTASIQLRRAISVTREAVFDPSRLLTYLTDKSMTLFVTVLCGVSMSLAYTYNANHLYTATIGIFHREAIRSYTVVLLWLRLFTVLTVTSKTGGYVCASVWGLERPPPF
jgi:hypothetical protein